MHLARKVLQLDPGVLQAAALDVLVRRVRQDFVQRDDVTRDLVHRVGEEGFERAAFAGRVLFESREDAGKLRILFAFRQNLETKMVIADVFLVDVEHRQENVKQITYFK